MLEQASTTRTFIEMEEKYGAHNYHPLDVVIERAQGVWVYDVEGKRYLDCLASYSAVNQGHCHPAIMAAMQAQMGRVTLTSRAFRNDQLPRLYKMLHDLTGYEMSLPMNSGAEAVETAVKAARKWGYTVKGIPADRAEIIACADNFHGRTTTIVSFSTDEQYRDGFGPLTPGFTIVPYGDADALERAITPHTAAFLVEPIQGEAGIIIPPAGYLKRVEAICKAHNVLFIADEIQSGLGRTGKMFAHEWEGVRPDMVTVAKALSGGYYPISVVLGRADVLGVFKPGDHGSTFGGNPLACAVARAALQVLIDEKLVERSAELGEYFLAKLRTLTSPAIKEVRGRGLWIGLDLHGAARPYCERLKEVGVLCKETHDHVIRLAPPLVITREEIDWAFDRIKKVIEG
ncbi:MAG: ornithine--oxo-acid transaminase [Vicinamibacterales bacterium]|nr:ornithine--oxo-acid transaminase [Vicinamibacterales bacterium]